MNINGSMKGKSHTDASKLKMRLKKLGIPKSEAHKQKISTGMLAYRAALRRLEAGPSELSLP